LSQQLHARQNDDRFAQLHAWILDNLAGDLSVTTLAAQAGMSERSFVRHYHAQTGNTPARAVEQLRVEAARRLLADSNQPLKRIAARCGFGSEETLRRCFLRSVAVTPQAYRERFSVPVQD
jgi:transcriptional regulator GlxA family with amidase domain